MAEDARVVPIRPDLTPGESYLPAPQPAAPEVARTPPPAAAQQPVIVIQQPADQHAAPRFTFTRITVPNSVFEWAMLLPRLLCHAVLFGTSTPTRFVACTAVAVAALAYHMTTR